MKLSGRNRFRFIRKNERSLQMEELEALKERWREAKQTRTIQDIADCAGLSRQSVEYAFSKKSKNLKIDTVVRISRELCVSVDEVCGILSAPTEQENMEKKDAHHWHTLYIMAEKENTRQRKYMAFLAMVVLVLSARVILLDLSCVEIGAFRGEWTVSTITSFLCIGAAAVISVVLIVKAVVFHVQSKHNKTADQ